MPRNEQHSAPPVLHQLSGTPITEHEHEGLQNFLTILRTKRGCATPIETFLADLVHFHQRYPLTPDYIREQFTELEEGWKDFISAAVFTIQRYPELVRQQLPEGSVLRTAAEIQKAAEEQIRIEQRKTQQERKREESETRNTADVARAERQRAQWRKQHPDYAARIDQYMDWARTLDDESKRQAAGHPFRLLHPSEWNKKPTELQTKKAPHSGKRGARKSATLDEKAQTLSGTGYQVAGQPKPIRPEMPA